MRDAFHILGDGNLLYQRGQRFRNDILLLLESNNVPTDAVHFEMKGPYIRLSMQAAVVPSELQDDIAQRLEDFEMGITYPPTEEEAKFMLNLLQGDS